MIYKMRPFNLGDEDLVSPNISYSGKCSTFGGPKDKGVTSTEGLALFEWSDIHKPEFAWLFNPVARMGLARNLNPSAWYCAMRWDYTKTTKDLLRREGIVEVTHNGKTIFCTPVDWGPNVRTERLIDLSPGAAFQLGVKTDSEVSARLVIGKRAQLV